MQCNQCHKLLDKAYIKHTRAWEHVESYELYFCETDCEIEYLLAYVKRVMPNLAKKLRISK